MFNFKKTILFFAVATLVLGGVSSALAAATTTREKPLPPRIATSTPRLSNQRVNPNTPKKTTPKTERTANTNRTKATTPTQILQKLGLKRDTQSSQKPLAKTGPRVSLLGEVSDLNDSSHTFTVTKRDGNKETVSFDELFKTDEKRQELIKKSEARLKQLRSDSNSVTQNTATGTAKARNEINNSRNAPIRDLSQLEDGKVVMLIGQKGIDSTITASSLFILPEVKFAQRKVIETPKRTILKNTKPKRIVINNATSTASTTLSNLSTTTATSTNIQNTASVGDALAPLTDNSTTTTSGDNQTASTSSTTTTESSNEPATTTPTVEDDSSTSTSTSTTSGSDNSSSTTTDESSSTSSGNTDSQQTPPPSPTDETPPTEPSNSGDSTSDTTTTIDPPPPPPVITDTPTDTAETPQQ